MFDQTENEGLSISKSNGFRTKRPSKRPKKTWGHGLKQTWKEKLKNKREKKPERVVRDSVPQVPMPNFLTRMLDRHALARRIMTPEQYAANKAQGRK